jgi:hypothetical protein
MASGFSPQNEQFLHDVVAGGLYPSKEAALNAAVDALRTGRSDADDDNLPMVPEEHMAGVEEGLADLEAGRCIEMTPNEWERLRQFARDVAAGKNPPIAE